MTRAIDHKQEIGAILENVGAIAKGQYELVGEEQKKVETATGKKPLSGEVLTGKKGGLRDQAGQPLTTDKILHSCLAAQAAERTIWAGEEHGDDHIKTPVKDGKFQIEDSNFTRSYIGKDKNEPRTLIQSQAVGHLAALLDGATQINPKLNGNKTVTEAKDALQVIGAHHYISAARMLKDGAAELSDPVKKESMLRSAAKMEKEGKEIIKANPNMNYNQALVKLNDSLEVAANSLPADQKEAFNDIVGKRAVQIKLDLKAHEIADDLKKTQNGKGSDDRPTVNHLKKQFGLSTDTPKGQLGTESSNHLVQGIAKVAGDGVPLAKIKEIKDLFSNADKGMTTKRDHGVSSLSAKELQDVRKQLRDGLSK